MFLCFICRSEDSLIYAECCLHSLCQAYIKYLGSTCYYKHALKVNTLLRSSIDPILHNFITNLKAFDKFYHESLSYKWRKLKKLTSTLISSPALIHLLCTATSRNFPPSYIFQPLGIIIQNYHRQKSIIKPGLIEFIKVNPNLHQYFNLISRNPNITPEIISANPNLPWEWGDAFHKIQTSP
jgi:hypothetical protein